MKIACKLALILAACLSQAIVIAAEPAVNPIAEEHTLGRVFMSSAERRRLDLLRRYPESGDQPGPASPVSSTRLPAASKATKPVGYIIPTNGKSYQWIEGDFRKVDQIDAGTTNISPGIKITRHVNRGDNGAPLPETENTKHARHKQGIDAEAGDGDGSQR